MRIAFAILAWAAGLASLGTVSNAGEARAPATFMYILMVDVIGPAANSLWAAAAAPTATLSDQDWARVKQMAARLTESAHSVAFGGTTPEDIERTKSNAWKSWATEFADKASLTASAVERKDKMAFTAAADDLLAVCEGCHVAFPQTAR